MAVLEKSNTTLEILTALGLKEDNCTEVRISISPDDVIKVSADYIIDEKEWEKLNTVVKKFRIIEEDER